MAEDIVVQKLDEVLARLGPEEDDFSVFLGRLDEVVGFVANFLQILPYIEAAIEGGPSDSVVLGELYTTAEGLVNLSGATYSAVMMMGMNAFFIPATTDLLVLARETATGPDVNPSQFRTQALDYATAAADSAYWYRPFLSEKAFLPQVMQNVAHLGDPSAPGQQAGLHFPFTLGWYGNAAWDDNLPGLAPPTDTQHVAGYTTVLDPHFILPVVVSAIETNLGINYLLGQASFDYFLSTFNQDIAGWADSLYRLYVSVVRALVKSDVPTANDVIGYLWIWGNVPSAGLTSQQPELPCASIQQPVGGPLEKAHPDHSGCAWNGVYGVVDLYGVYNQYVAVPSSGAFHIVDLFTSDHIPELPQDHPYLPGHTPYRWVHDRVTVGLMARWKTVYMLLGCDHAWSVLQNLRALLKQPGDKRLTLPDGTTAGEDWSVRELIAALNLRPLWQATYPDYVAEPWYRVFYLAQRLDLMSRGTWLTPLDDDAFDNDERLNHTVVTRRPVSLRSMLAAAAG